MKNMYRISLTAKKWTHQDKIWQNVHIRLAKDELSVEEKKMIPVLIRDYKKISIDDKIYAQLHTEELFTENEVQDILMFFMQYDIFTISIQVCEMPYDVLDKNGKVTITQSLIPFDRHTECYEFFRRKDWKLSQKIVGYYRVTEENLKKEGGEIFENQF